MGLAVRSDDLPVRVGDAGLCNVRHVAAQDFPDGVTEIEDSLFRGCTDIETLVIPRHVQRIGRSAFRGCTSITSLTFEGGSELSYIGFSAFAGIAVTTLTIPRSVTKIAGDTEDNAAAGVGSDEGGIGAFQDCTALATLTFESESQLRFIGYRAFKGYFTKKEWGLLLSFEVSLECKLNVLVKKLVVWAMVKLVVWATCVCAAVRVSLVRCVWVRVVV